MENCTFCGSQIPIGTGKMFIKKDGKVLRFCSMKCEKNMLKHGKKAVKTKWTNAHHEAKEANK